MIRVAAGAAAAFALATLLTAPVSAQWENWPVKNVPRLANGKVDMKAPPRRTADGKIDLQGFWLPTNPVKHLLNIAADLKPGEVPLQPWAQKELAQRIETNGKDHPGVRCWPSGIPEKLNIPDGLKLVQTPDLMLFLHESRTIYRQVFTDGRPLPKDPQPAWQGYSVGRWDGDALVVESLGFRDDGWLDVDGSYFGSTSRVTERFRRVNYGRLELDVTVQDAKAYTRPWTVRINYRLIPDQQLIEFICNENEQSSKHYVKP
jgi:hypothetical protein